MPLLFSRREGKEKEGKRGEARREKEAIEGWRLGRGPGVLMRDSVERTG